MIALLLTSLSSIAVQQETGFLNRTVAVGGYEKHGADSHPKEYRRDTSRRRG